jgi:2-desacetyl-2-hydroxyethyl bacteriochlorophyllide A dehydrogenase
MKAVLIKEFKKDFVVEDVEMPKVVGSDVLVQVKATGLCAADGKIRDGKMPSLKLPHIPGHEVAGEVVEAGPAAREFKAGDRVVAYMYTVCGDCPACRRGRENLCSRIVRMGFDRYGGHAEYVSIPERQLVKLPETIPFEEGAAIPDAVSTMLHAIREQGEVKLNDYVVLLGVGGLGMQGIQIARLSGARVIAVARNEKKLELAKTLGAEWVLSGRDPKLAEKILNITRGRGADAVIDLVSTQETFQTAVGCIRKGGSIVIVGSTGIEITFSVGQVMFNEIAVKGSIGMTKQTIVDAVDLCGSGKIKPVVTDRYPLDGINDAAGKLSRGEILGRAVLIP